MKVNIYETVEISDEQRVQLGAIIDGKVKPKRQATRDEIKAFIWEHGSDWETALSEAFSSFTGEGAAEAADAPEEADEDLLGGDDETPDDEFDDEDLI